jgi:hypothetical protein
MAGQILRGLHRSGYGIVDFPCAGDEFATAAGCTRGSRTDAECSAISATSMRRLWRELGRSAMAAYWYVEDKQQLMSLVVLHADEIPDQEHRPDNLEDAVARQLPHLERLRGRDFFSYGVDTIIAGLRARLKAKSQA